MKYNCSYFEESLVLTLGDLLAIDWLFFCSISVLCTCIFQTELNLRNLFFWAWVGNKNSQIRTWNKWLMDKIADSSTRIKTKWIFCTISFIFAKNQQQKHWVGFMPHKMRLWEMCGWKHDTGPCREINFPIWKYVSLKLLHIQWWCPHFIMHSFSFFSLEHFAMRLGFFN